MKDNRDELINKIRSMLNADIENVVVLVEGPDDIEFFNRVLEDYANIAPYASISGCEGLYDLLAEPDLQSPRVVAVRDRDYTDPEKYPPRMFCYDDCALELMILHHSRIQQKLKPLYSLQERFPLDMMRRIAPFSLLRRENALHKDEWKIAFNDKDENGKGGISILAEPKKIPGKKKIKLPNVERVFSLYESDYPQVMAGQYQFCLNAAGALSDDELWNVTNGHDICRTLGSLSSLSSGSLGEDGYRRLMIMIYQPDYFKDTFLYGKLSEYALPDGRTPFRMSD